MGKKSRKSGKSPEYATIRVEVYRMDDDIVDAIVGDDQHYAEADRHLADFGPDLVNIQAMDDKTAGESPATDQLTMLLIQALKRQLEEQQELNVELQHRKELLELDVEILKAENDLLEESYNVETLINGLKPLLIEHQRA